MAEKLTDWLKKAKELEKIPQRKMTEVMFFRDPTHPHMFNRGYFYACTDGIILYQKTIEFHEKIEIKGKYFSLQSMFEGIETPSTTCLCICIFMTYYDVHVIRMPYSGILNSILLPPITTYNSPMLMAENDLLNKHFNKVFTDMNYEKDNARMINTIYSPELDYKYYLIEIADDEVNTIQHFTINQNQWFHQNQKFSFVRYGSECIMILPLDPRYEFDPIVPSEYHVSGGIDKLVKITPH